MNRRKFLEKSGKFASMAFLASMLPAHKLLAESNKKMFFDISLGQYSLHRQLESGKLTTLNFPAKAKQTFGIDAVEYVNKFFLHKAKDKGFIDALKLQAEDHGVKSLMILVDGEGDLGHLEKVKRVQAVENHYKWVEAARQLGCHSIRVNAYGQGDKEEVKKATVDGLRKLTEFARDYDIQIIVENHGGYSSDGKWLAEVMKTVAMPDCGTLPDFGNFGDYDRYQGVADLLPYAKGISAKSYDFDGAGNETNTDFKRMLKLIKASNYRGYIGIEYEGESDDEDRGVLATKHLLQRLGAALS